MQNYTNQGTIQDELLDLIVLVACVLGRVLAVQTTALNI